MGNHDLGEIIRRLDAVETAVKDQGVQIAAQGQQLSAQSTQFTDITVKIALLDKGVSLIEKGMDGLRGEMEAQRHARAESDDKLNRAITSTGLELSKSIDLIIKALRLDQDANSVKNIGDNIDFAGRLKVSYERRREWIERAAIGGLIAVAGTALFKGLQAWLAP